MPMCALRIPSVNKDGDFRIDTWKVVGVDKHEDIHVERVPRATVKQGKLVLDTDFEDFMVFVYLRTNNNGMEEFNYVSTNRQKIKKEEPPKEVLERATEPTNNNVAVSTMHD